MIQEHILKLRMAAAEALSHRAVGVHEGRTWTRITIDPPITRFEVDDWLERNSIGSHFGLEDGVFIRSTQLLGLNSKMNCWSASLAAGPPRSAGVCAASALAFSPSHLWYTDEGGEAKRVRLRSLGAFGGALPAPTEFVCNDCYALKGAYGSPNMVVRMAVLTAWALRSVRDGTFAPVMIRAIKRADDWSERTGGAEAGFFRIHDTGDFFSMEHLRAWKMIAHSLRDINFWAPCRAWLMDDIARELSDPAPQNLIIRPSLPVYGGLPPRLDPPLNRMAAPTIVEDKHVRIRGVYNCPATHSAAKSCVSARCRSCWSKRHVPIKYAKH